MKPSPFEPHASHRVASAFKVSDQASGKATSISAWPDRAYAHDRGWTLVDLQAGLRFGLALTVSCCRRCISGLSITDRR